jgi:hypothetical protein
MCVVYYTYKKNSSILCEKSINTGKQIRVGIHTLKLLVGFPNGLGRFEKTPISGFRYHGKIVKGVSGCEYFDVQGLKSRDRLFFAVFLSEFVARYAAAGGRCQAVAKKGGIAQFCYERPGEFLIRVRKYDELRSFPQRSGKFDGSLQRLHAAYHASNIRQLQIVLCKKLDSETHKFVVIGFITGGSAEFAYARSFRKGYPNFGNKHPFKIKTYQFHAMIVIKSVSTNKGARPVILSLPSIIVDEVLDTGRTKRKTLATSHTEHSAEPLEDGKKHIPNSSGASRPAYSAAAE